MEKRLISNVYIEPAPGPGFYYVRTRNHYMDDGKVVLHETAISKIYSYMKRRKKKQTKRSKHP